VPLVGLGRQLSAAADGFRTWQLPAKCSTLLRLAEHAGLPGCTIPPRQAQVELPLVKITEIDADASTLRRLEPETG
jgi:hypothetical protein